MPGGNVRAVRVTHAVEQASARQVQVPYPVADGLSNAEVATRLSITSRTVDDHVSAVPAKLDVHSRQAASALAREHRRAQQK
jgi:DNA-binding NarL/FixJ family response regulator